VQVFKIFTTEKKNKSTLLNILGVQPLRTFIAYRLQSRKRVSLDIALPQNTKQMIDQNGYLKLDDFIDSNDFVDLKRDCKHAFENHPNRNIVNEISVNYVWVPITKERMVEYQAISKFLVSKQLEFITEFASYNQGQKLSTEDIELYLHRVWTSDGYKNEPNQMMHVDTFHSSTKGWIYLDDVGKDEGPLNYLPKSNCIDSWRLGFEYRSSILQKQCSGSWRIEDSEWKKKYGSQKEFIVKENTCVIADTIGFHRRGDAKQGIKRDSIFFSVRKSPF